MTVEVYSANHPMKAANVHVAMPEGSTVAEMLETVQPDPVLRQHALIYIGDRVIPRAYWSYVRPKDGQTVSVRVLPQGDDAKDVVSVILTIVVFAYSGYISTEGIAALGISGGTTASAIAGAAVAVVGQMAINALIPPQQPKMNSSNDSTVSPHFDIRGARNQPRPYSPIPRVFGTHRMVPPYAALPYTEIRGNNQFLNVAVCWGYGPVDVEQMDIGETIIDEFDGVRHSTDLGDGDGFEPRNLFTKSVNEEQFNILLGKNSGPDNNGWIVRTTDLDTDRISLDVIFPRGLVRYNDKGKRRRRTVNLSVQYAPTGTNNWSTPETGSSIPAITGFNIPSGLVKVPIAHRRGVMQQSYHRGVLIYMDQYKATVGAVGGTKVLRESDLRYPNTPDGCVPLARVGLHGNNIHTVNNLSRESETFGSSFDFQVSDSGGSTVDITSGTLFGYRLKVTSSNPNAIRKTIAFDVDRGQYDVRIRRMTNDSNDDQISDEVYWSVFRSIQDIKPFQLDGLAITTARIKATDQLNGVVDELNAIVTSIFPDYDIDTDTWIERPTNNPASHVRAVLQGKENQNPVSDSRIDLEKLEYFHTYCEENEFYYNGIIDTETSVWDVLTELCAVAKARPAMIDGTWTVIIDEEKTVPVQHFTPQNTSDFSGSKAFSKHPHALRIEFNNWERGYQRDEVLVYDDGYDSSNATLFDTIQTRGITNYQQAWKYGRYLLAAMKLRPETYTFNTGIENLVATRGDLIRMSHDVPLWGVSSGYVKELIMEGGEVTGAVLDETIYFIDGNDYAARARLSNNDTALINLSYPESGEGFVNFQETLGAGDVNVTGYAPSMISVSEWSSYAQVTTTSTLDRVLHIGTNQCIVIGFTPVITTSNVEGDVSTNTITFLSPMAPEEAPEIGNMVMVGVRGSESVELIIKEIRPGPDLTAKIVCVDASPAIHTADTEAIPAFDSQITNLGPFDPVRPPAPIVDNVESDERVLLRKDDGTLIPRLMIYFSEPSTGQANPEYVQARITQAGEDYEWTYRSAPSHEGQIGLTDVDEGASYRVEIRSVTELGTVSDWVVATSGETVVGKSSPPPNVTDLSGSTANWISSGSKSYGIRLQWFEVDVSDLDRYEIRTVDSGFGIDNGDLVGRPKDNVVNLPIAGSGTYTFYVRAKDTSGNYSESSASVSVVVEGPSSVDLSSRFSGEDLVLSWEEFEGDFPTSFYDIRRGGSDYDSATRVTTVKSEEFRIPADWVGEETWYVAPVDVAGNYGPSVSTNPVVTAPGAPNPSGQVIDNNALLRWEKVKGTLPIPEFEIRKGSESSSAEVLGRVDSTFHVIYETVAGTYTYWVVPVDSAGNFGSAESVTSTVSEPPDFVLNSSFASNNGWSGTKTSCLVENTDLVAPVNITETWEEHFTTNTWDTPQDQIDAGYDVYIQPTMSTSSYEEVFNVGTTVLTSTVTFNRNVEDIVAGVTVTPTVSVAPDDGGSPGTWRDYNGQWSVLESNFRFVKIKLDFTQSGDDGLVRVRTLTGQVSVKTITDEGSGTAIDTDSGGTTVLFNKTFSDITSLTVTAKGTSSVTAVYDFVDAPNPTEFSVYLFDNTGTRVSGDFSWNARGVLA